MNQLIANIVLPFFLLIFLSFSLEAQEDNMDEMMQEDTTEMSAFEKGTESFPAKQESHGIYAFLARRFYVCAKPWYG